MFPGTDNTSRVSVACWAVVFLVTSCPSRAKGTCSEAQEDQACYYTVSNYSEGSYRAVDILLDAENFTEPKLRRLMDHFRNKYSERIMFVFLYSHLEQLDSRNNLHLIRESLTDTDAPTFASSLIRYPRGVLLFEGANQVIRYNTPGEDLCTVVVQGVDPTAVRNH